MTVAWAPSGVLQNSQLRRPTHRFLKLRSQNSIRPFAVGRKNWLFSDSVKGADASAVVYTIVEMARAHDLNIYGYLKYLLDQRPDQSWTDEQLADLAPWSEKLQHLKNRM